MDSEQQVVSKIINDLDIPTIVKLDPNGICVSDTYALDYAKSNISNNVNVGTIVMMDAFRVLKRRGEIKKLTFIFEDGSTSRTDKFGNLEHWPKGNDSPIVETHNSFLEELCGF